MAKRINRFHGNNQIKTYNPHVMIVGKSGSGKSNTGSYLLTEEWRKGKKCFDLIDNGRFENATYSIKEHDPFMCKLIKQVYNGKRSPVEVVSEVVLVKGKRLEFLKNMALPRNMDIRTLDPDTVRVNDIIEFIATTEPSKQLAFYITDKYPESNILEFLEILGQEHMLPERTHPMALATLKRNTKNLLNSGMFDDDFQRIDIRKMIQDADKITSFCTWLLEEEDHEAIFYGLILKLIVREKMKLKSDMGSDIEKDPNPLAVYIREVHKFFGKHVSDYYKFAQRELLRCIREGRDLKIKILCDTQKLTDLDGPFRAQFALTINMNVDNNEAEKLKDIKGLPPDVVKEISKLKKGWAVVIDSETFHYPVQFAPAMHHHKREGENIFKLLGSKFGFKSVNDCMVAATEKSNRDEKGRPIYV